MAQINLSETGIARKNDSYRFEWKRLYQGALFETDPGKIRVRIVDAEIAVLKRGAELVGHPLGREHQELDDAWRFLHLLERERSNGSQTSCISSGLTHGVVAFSS